MHHPSISALRSRAVELDAEALLLRTAGSRCAAGACNRKACAYRDLADEIERGGTLPAEALIALAPWAERPNDPLFSAAPERVRVVAQRSTPKAELRTLPFSVDPHPAHSEVGLGRSSGLSLCPSPRADASLNRHCHAWPSRQTSSLSPDSRNQGEKLPALFRRDTLREQFALAFWFVVLFAAMLGYAYMQGAGQ